MSLTSDNTLTKSLDHIAAVVGSLEVVIDPSEEVDWDVVSWYESRMKQCVDDGVLKAAGEYMMHATKNNKINYITMLTVILKYREVTACVTH